jgi:hypothetical protein
MSHDHTAEIARLKAAIADMMKRVPASITGGGMKITQAYKEAINAAKKAIAASRPNLGTLQEVQNKLSAYGA